VLRRDGNLLSKEMKAVSTDALIASLPRASAPLTPVAFSVNRTEPLRAAPFMSGLKVHRDGVGLVVDSVVIGSPASQAGVLPGDVLINSEATPDLVQYSSYRRMLDLTVKHGTTIRKVNLTVASLTDLFNGARSK
jgi:S1-C subfamily serine protease